MRAMGPAPEREMSAFEAVTRAQLAALRAEVAELKGRVTVLLWAVMLAVTIEIVTTLLR